MFDWNPQFQRFPKIPRLKREIVITEKLDGSNGVIFIGDDFETMHVGSRNRWITPEDDHHGFARWAYRNHDELLRLGPGFHYGEWWGSGIQCGYGLPKGEKRFSLFNTKRWVDPDVRPACCDVVPTLYVGPFRDSAIEDALYDLSVHGSRAAPGFMHPEGVMIYHTAARQYFKRTFRDDHKG